MTPFMFATIVETITEESARDGDVASSEMSDDAPASFREALGALEDGCWDYLDWRAAEVIAYPADFQQDFGTGEYEGTTLVIRAGRPEWLERLANTYYGRKEAS